MKTFITLLFVILFIASCSQEISMQQAANNHYKSTRSVR